MNKDCLTVHSSQLTATVLDKGENVEMLFRKWGGLGIQFIQFCEAKDKLSKETAEMNAPRTGDIKQTELRDRHREGIYRRPAREKFGFRDNNQDE